MSNMARLEALALSLPEAERVDIEAWGDRPTFRVRVVTSYTLVAPKSLARLVSLPPDQ